MSKPLIKKRLNITLSAEMNEVLSVLSKRDNTPQATKAVALLEKALEIEEDEIWNTVAENRRNSNPNYISHEEAWK